MDELERRRGEESTSSRRADANRGSFMKQSGKMAARVQLRLPYLESKIGTGREVKIVEPEEFEGFLIM